MNSPWDDFSINYGYLFDTISIIRILEIFYYYLNDREYFEKIIKYLNEHDNNLIRY